MKDNEIEELVELLINERNNSPILTFENILEICRKVAQVSYIKGREDGVEEFKKSLSEY